MSIASGTSGIEAAAPSSQPVALDALYRKVTWRFMPLLFVCYVFNYMDRTNIGFAQLQMKGDLGFSDVAYGLGASLFFVTYSIFALPSNLVMTRVGARITIFFSLFTWGLTSAGTMFVRTPKEFYAIRLLLGVVEAGFFPGIIYYFGEWFPSHRRANITGIFTSATVVAGIVSGVLSGAIIEYLNGFLRLRGWQWMFVLEGLPCALLGIVVYFFLDDQVEEAKWLSPAEKKTLRAAISEDPVGATTSQTLGNAVVNWRVYLLGLIYFLAVFATFVVAFWQPTMIKGFGVSSVMAIGLYSTIPPLAAVIAKIWIGAHSDKKKELRWHFTIAAVIGAIGFSLIPQFPHSPFLGILCLTIATAGVHASIPIVWAAPGLYLSGTAAAGGIAIISTMGTLSGAFGPALLGWIKTATGGFDDGMYALSGLLILASFLMLGLVSDKRQAPASKSAD